VVDLQSFHQKVCSPEPNHLRVFKVAGLVHFVEVESHQVQKSSKCLPSDVDVFLFHDLTQLILQLSDADCLSPFVGVVYQILDGIHPELGRR